ncbi:MAG: hypothetical protein ACRCZQ_10945, partial [Bacteroidales bacterium]
VSSKVSTEKINKTNTQTHAISIFFETKQGHLIKLLYDNNLDLSVWQQATSQFFDLMEQHYEENENDPISIYINQISKLKATKNIYAIIDPETKSWVLIHNPIQYLTEREKNI